MDETLALVLLLGAYGLLLLVPWIACAWVFRWDIAGLSALFSGGINPYGSQEQAVVAARAKLFVAWPATLVLLIGTVVVADDTREVILAVFVPVALRFCAAFASRTWLNLPATTALFPLLVPSLVVWLLTSWLSQALNDEAITVGLVAGQVFLGAVVGYFLIVFGGQLLGRMVVGAWWLWFRVTFGGRLARGGRGVLPRWRVVKMGRVDGNPVLLFTEFEPVPWPRPDPPRFRVTLVADEDWAAERGEAMDVRKRGGEGGGPVRSAVVGPVGPNVRGAIARLDDRTVAHIAETNLGGDDFFEFITQIRPV